MAAWWCCGNTRCASGARIIICRRKSVIFELQPLSRFEATTVRNRDLIAALSVPQMVPSCNLTASLRHRHNMLIAVCSGAAWVLKREGQSKLTLLARSPENRRVASAAWSWPRSKGKQYVCGMEDGTLERFSLGGVSGLALFVCRLTHLGTLCASCSATRICSCPLSCLGRTLWGSL